MRQTQKSASEMALIRIAFIAKNCLRIIAHYPEYLLSVGVLIAVIVLRLVEVML